jgi:hypothetical protein
MQDDYDFIKEAKRRGYMTLGKWTSNHQLCRCYVHVGNQMRPYTFGLEVIRELGILVLPDTSIRAANT